MNLRWRLTWLYVAGTALAVVAALVILQFAYRFGSTTLADRALMQATESTLEIMEEDPPFKMESAPVRFADLTEGHEGLFLALCSRAGAPLYQSDPQAPLCGGRDMPNLAEDRVRFRSSRSPLGKMRIASVWTARSSTPVLLELGIPLPSAWELLSRWQTYLVAGFFLLLLALIGGSGWWMAGRALAPIQGITGVAQRVSRGDLTQRIPRPPADDDVGQLIDILNEMLGRLERSAVWLQQFASNISHQLRTPLTILRGETEVALRGVATTEDMRTVLKSNLAELEKMSNLVQDMLNYSALENQAAAGVSCISIDKLIGGVARQATWLGRVKNIHVGVAAEPVSAWIHPVPLEQALLNILDNAVKHTPANGSIQLTVAADGDSVQITIEDDGPGVPAAELGELFRRGRSQSGSGIGLVLARTLVESLGGTLSAEPGQERGLRVNLRFPLANDKQVK